MKNNLLQNDKEIIYMGVIGSRVASNINVNKFSCN